MTWFGQKCSRMRWCFWVHVMFSHVCLLPSSLSDSVTEKEEWFISRPIYSNTLISIAMKTSKNHLNFTVGLEMQNFLSASTHAWQNYALLQTTLIQKSVAMHFSKYGKSINIYVSRGLHSNSENQNWHRNSLDGRYQVFWMVFWLVKWWVCSDIQYFAVILTVCPTFSFFSQFWIKRHQNIWAPNLLIESAKHLIRPVSLSLSVF